MSFSFEDPFSYQYSSYGKPAYSSMNDKSQAALRREQTAIALFDKLRSEPPPTARTVTHLLEPSCHLTSACWSTFGKHVRSFPGWEPKRRVATPEEKKAAKETRKGPVYFVDVVYDPAKKARAATKKPARKVKRNKIKVKVVWKKVPVSKNIFQRLSMA